ncbi:MAG: helix-turn-helix domain-containing protein [Dehalococcoidia bacterium]
MDNPTIRRRNRLKHHYTMTSNVLIFGYKQLTDPVKLTYQAIDSFDWSDADGKRKGYAYPSLSTLARLRKVDERTLRRHLAALEDAGLLRRELRAGQPSLLWIEEPSAEECESYLSTIAMSPDRDVRGTPDKNVRPLDEESEESETDKTVNGVKAFKGRRGGKRFLSAQERAKRDYIAREILKVCGDEHSLPFYRTVASRTPSSSIFEALSELRQRLRSQPPVTNKGAFLTAILRANTNGSK